MTLPGRASVKAWIHDKNPEGAAYNIKCGLWLPFGHSARWIPQVAGLSPPLIRQKPACGSLVIKETWALIKHLPVTLQCQWRPSTKGARLSPGIPMELTQIYGDICILINSSRAINSYSHFRVKQWCFNLLFTHSHWAGVWLLRHKGLAVKMGNLKHSKRRAQAGSGSREALTCTRTPEGCEGLKGHGT